MTTRSDHRLRERFAHIAAILIFSLVQFITVAHAEYDHDADASTAHCTICFLTFSDDDIDASSIAGDSSINRTLEREALIPASQVVTARFESYSIARGPPQN